MHLMELLQLAVVVSHTAVYKRYIRRFPFFRDMILCRWVTGLLYFEAMYCHCLED